MVLRPSPRASLVGAVVAFSFVGFAARAAAQGRPLAIEDYYRIKTVSGPTISPDARWVAFSVATRVEETNGSTSEIWLVPADASTSARRVSTGNAVGADWTADGRLHFSDGGHPVAIDPANPDRIDSSVVQAGAPAGRGRGRGGVSTRTTFVSPDGKLSALIRVFPPLV